MKKAPDATLIICAFNQASTIIAALKALNLQMHTEGYNIQIIIVDDGSSYAQVDLILKEFETLDTVIDIKLVWQQNREFRLSASRNNGLSIADGQIIIFIDGDCISERNFLSSHIRAHQEYIDQALLTGHRCFDMPQIHNNTDIRSLDFLKAKERKEAYDIKKRANSKNPWSSIIGRNFSFRKMDNVLKFDDNIIGWGFEDIAFAADYYKLGCQNFAYLSNAIVTQIDDFYFSNNPYILKSQKNIAYAISNVAMTMQRFEYNKDIYNGMAVFLSQYIGPFKLHDGKYIYIPEIADEVFKKSAAGLEYTYHDAKILYFNAINELIEFFETNLDIKPHPFVNFLFTGKFKDNKPSLSIVAIGKNGAKQSINFLRSEKLNLSQSIELIFIFTLLEKESFLEQLSFAELYASNKIYNPEIRLIMTRLNTDVDQLEYLGRKLARGEIITLA